MVHTAHDPSLLSSRSYNGAETIAAFADPANELRALTSGCGVFDLRWRAKFSAGGQDRVRWLNAMVTNAIKDLPANRGNYNFVLNPQGRILGDLYIYNRGEYLLLDTDRSQLETVRNTLKRFIIMDKVELADSNLSAIAVCGPKSESVLSAAGIDVSGMAPLEVRDAAVNESAVTLVRGPENKGAWYEVWAAQEQLLDPKMRNTGAYLGTPLEPIWEKLTSGGAQPVGTDALEQWRILCGIPNYGQDIRERDLPQETEQTQALNFTKGCYIGQEIVERIRSRGQVHRQFAGFEFHHALPQPGKFEENGRLLADLTSVAEIGGRKIGLGYVRRENGAPGTKLTLGGVEATVSKLPFHVA